ncbi:isocitrate lyase/PEP mutase family protein [Histidinibacterium aquaticum]|uniref:Isocitrate lyase/phosphoenolpyruvate mutase family protein n=1 Tax=Histidinibacterium aquaticum TaxID=2613962 RepID=A0A5J5GLG3_9RHOB|nr:isocitrate lyase/phosphoenolpyruvate mutase family protein [Histidinibacterium aquaticum]KAA9009139.1 isocitrate lyase/phosphoenolpyruvate mutase family protein [Histidinibacterium aquaticum]
MSTDPGADFRALHRKGTPFILANAWDRGSARMLEALGAQAVATSSAAHGFTLGRPDGGTITRDEALAHAREIVEAVSVPVQGDFENGFGPKPEDVAETVRLAAEAGLAGICIEDTDLPGQDPYPFDAAVERIRAGAEAARSLDKDFVLTARADGLLTGGYDIGEAIRRLQAFETAGADCLYAPLPAHMDDLRRICAETSAPVNALVAGHYTTQTVEDFAEAGVARLSLGSSLARVTHQAIIDASRDMFGPGRFIHLGRAASGDEVDALLKRD